MTSARTPRWALSFADLCLVLLGFFILLHAQSGDRTRLAQGLRSAFGNAGDVSARRHELTAAALFQPGEAVLTRAGERRILLLARGAPTARIESSGSDAGGQRFDRWELAAARVAAIARAVKAAGVPEPGIEVAIPAMDAKQKGQRISIIIE
jgi:hypothetical protein